MTRRKAIRATIITGLVALVALAAGVGVSGARTKGEIPEYLGSKACLGCHVDQYMHWDETDHANDLLQLIKESDFPGKLAEAPEELKPELEKATWLFAGRRFLARAPETGKLTFLNVQWDSSKDTYVSYNGGSDFEARCATCHSTGWDTEVAVLQEPGVGCESCHGPGRDHVLGKGDISKITTGFNSQSCVECHSSRHSGQGPEWEASAHGLALSPVIRNEQGQPDPNGKPYRDSCFACHSGEGFVASLKGEAFSATENHPNNNPVTCAACHDPHNNEHTAQLRVPGDQLCITCHTASLPVTGLTPGARVGHQPQKEMVAGYGAAGVEPYKGVHSNVTCVECHMVSGNHAMTIAKPDAVQGNSPDSCTQCHTDSTRESRAAYLDTWQQAIAGRMTKAQADIAAIDKAVAANPERLTADLKLALDTAKGNLALVDGDQSKGAHNFEYAMKVMNSVAAQLEQVRTAVVK